MLLDQYIQYISNQKRYSAHSVTAYHNDILQFCQFIQTTYNSNELSEITYSMMRSWIAQLVNEQYSSTSVNRKLSAVKSFYKYLLIIKQIKINPATRLRALKTPKRLPVFIDEDKMQLLCNSFICNNSDIDTSFQQKRDQLLIEMFYLTGIRLSELVNIKANDIDFERNEIKILGKRNKERIVPMVQSLKILVKEFIDIRKQQFKILPNHLFITNKGEKIYPKLAYRIVNFYLENSTSLKKKSPHVLRHTFATHLLNNGADLNAIKELLGHANLSSTQVYTHNSITQLTNIYKQAHPRA